MSVISINWNKTKKSFLDWLIKSDLKIFFAENLYFENLSLWWLTDIYEKDALNNHVWFNNLNEILNKNSKIKIKKKSIIFESLKLILKLCKILFLLSFIKLFYKDKNLRKKVPNCVQVQFSNLVKHKDNYIDTQFGLFSLNNNKISYLIQLTFDFSLILNYFDNKKKTKFNSCKLLHFK